MQSVKSMTTCVREGERNRVWKCQIAAYCDRYKNNSESDHNRQVVSLRLVLTGFVAFSNTSNKDFA